MAGPRKPPPLSRLPLLRRRSPKRKRRVKIRSAASRHAKTLKYCRTLAASGYKTKTALSATSQKKISAQDWKKHKKLLTKPADNGGLKTKKPLVITRGFFVGDRCNYPQRSMHLLLPQDNRCVPRKSQPIPLQTTVDGIARHKFARQNLLRQRVFDLLLDGPF